MKTWLTSLLILILLIFQLPAEAKQKWTQWVSDLKKEAIAEGIDANLFDELFATISEPDVRVQHFNNHQPEHRIEYPEYKSTRADNYKILVGRKEYKKHKTILDNIARHYHVDACYIVALWGMETSYGRFTGKFPVVKSLATLAYKSNRETAFRQELLYALHMLNLGQVSEEQFKGEWAGATGQPQFLPSSWFLYAVDYDACGKKDIWTSYPDVFASIANYLVKNHWNNNEPVLIPIQLPENFDTQLIGRKNSKTAKNWQILGVRTITGDELPYPELQTSIVQPDGGSAFLIYPNFNVLLSYNNSIYYAGTVDYLAQSICKH